MEFDNGTKEQVVAIQSLQIIKYLLAKIQDRDVSTETTNKIQRMFNIINDNDIEYGVKETESN